MIRLIKAAKIVTK